jgi:hypothetical protein
MALTAEAIQRNPTATERTVTSAVPLRILCACVVSLRDTRQPIGQSRLSSDSMAR